MDAHSFGRLIDDVLLPMLPGTTRSAVTMLARRVRKNVSYSRAGGGNQLLLRCEAAATFEFGVSRSQKFTDSEVALAKAFVAGVLDVADALGKPFESEVLRGLPLRVVARTAGRQQPDVLRHVLEQFAAWAAEQYEGRPIASAVGIDRAAAGHVDIRALWGESFAPVLSNGMDTLIVLDGEGRVQSLTAVDAAAAAPYSPIRYAHVAGWSIDEKIAVVLNRNGEILVFTEGEMRFALRRGHWRHFTHDAIVSSVHLPQRKAAKVAVYETLLDVAFARSGGCIAVVDRTHSGHVSQLVADKDLVHPTPPGLRSIKAQFLAMAVGTSFPDLNRKVRAELVAMDGATILNHQGAILAAGAIVKIGAGSSGGGRLAATRSLAKLGFAAKVSQDGGVTGFDAAGRAAVQSDDAWQPCFEFG